MPWLIWLAFLVFVLAVVMLDLGVFHRTAHTMSVKEAIYWSLFWVALALGFNVVIYSLYEANWVWLSASAEQMTGREAATQFFTGYVLEKSLSVDNIFVIAMIFSYFAVPLSEQHRVLFWGILGAVVLRGAMIGMGAALIDRFEWIIYVFGVLLIVSAAKMLVVKQDNIAPDRNLLVRMTRRVYPVTTTFSGSRFFVSVDGRRAATPLFLTLMLIESSDIMFAIDSIPAVFAVTRDPFLIFTSNIFAILGLRSLYFVLAGFMDRFRYLKMSLVFILAYVGVKMLLSHAYPIPNVASLAIIGGILSVGILASFIAAQIETSKLAAPGTSGPGSEAVAAERKRSDTDD